jgi:hypothetical protein
MSAANPRDTALGRGGDLCEGAAGQVGQLHPLETGPQALDRIQFGRIAGQRLYHQPLPLTAQPGTHRVAAGGRAARPSHSSEAPLSSQNTIAARRRRALRRILGPVLGHPARNRLLVALDRAAGGTQGGSAAGGAAASTRDRDGRPRRSAARSPWRPGPGSSGRCRTHGRGRPGAALGPSRGAAGQTGAGGPGWPAALQRLRPTACQRACQRLTFWRATPRMRATSAWERPAADNVPACIRTASNADGRADLGRCGGRSHPARLPAQPRSCHRKSGSTSDVADAGFTCVYWPPPVEATRDARGLAGRAGGPRGWCRRSTPTRIRRPPPGRGH